MLITTVGAFAAFSLMTIAVGTDYWLYSRGVCRVKSNNENETSRKNEEVMTHSGLWRTCCLEGGSQGNSLALLRINDDLGTEVGREGGERGKAGSDEEGLFLPSVHPSKACLIHSHHAHTSPWKPAAPVCEIGPLLYLHTFPHPQPCFPSSSSPCSRRLLKNGNKHEMLPGHHTASQTCVKHTWRDAHAPVHISSNGQ
ncbi:Voltage-dependent calcium channel gamma-3 subunit [Anabarilius grahami]|uniref:Voltage-dependent calcium channel gamma-3 subunit n=1 Tax=Anabarilius grahami TaxID=495550 RepID=A0A3N0YT39_ANAGA|nr:Voltage-dependent calcium channel gamma-3 subunit [Anabarilius grahami]